MKSSQRFFPATAVRAIVLSGLVVIGLSGLSARTSVAGVFTLVDRNSSVDFDTNLQSNAVNWRVDGVDHLFQQAFWYRVGNVAEQSVHSLPVGFEQASNTNANAGPDTLFVAYNGAGFDIEVTYVLRGGAPGSRASDVAEIITINNLTSLPLDFHFFQYSDFDLQGSVGGDSAVFTNENAVRQYEGVMALNENVITPVPSHRELDFYANTLGRLNDGVATTLNDTPPDNVVFGPGDVTWAYQWDVTIPGHGSFQISKDKQITGVPEPATFALLTVAAGLLLCVRRKR